MIPLLLSWLILAVSFWVAAALLPGVRIARFGDAVVVAAIFGLVNTLLGWILFVALGVGTLGLGFLFAFLTRWVIDAILLKLTAAVTDRIAISSFGAALACALVMSATGTLGQWLLMGAR